jgi:hypothetical protein
MNAHDHWFTSGMETLASIAFQFGPFFFAVLFMLVITHSARNWYSESRAAGADPSERRTYQVYFQCTYSFGMVLVAASVGWWMVSQWGRHHAFEGIVVALHQNESLGPATVDPSFFVRELQHTEPAGAQSLRDYQFVQLLDHPPHRGDKVYLDYWEFQQLGGTGPPPGPSATLEVPIGDSSQFPQQFRIEHQNGAVILVPLR